MKSVVHGLVVMALVASHIAGFAPIPTSTKVKHGQNVETTASVFVRRMHMPPVWTGSSKLWAESSAEVATASAASSSATTDDQSIRLQEVEVANIQNNNNEENDPIQYSFNQWRDMNTNALINNAILVAIALAVLVKVTTVNFGMMRGWTTAEMALRLPIDNWDAYSTILSAAPIPTKAVTSATVYTIGDLIAQRTEGRDMGDLDRMRTLRSLVAGLIAHGPMSHVWYDVSEGLFEHVLHWTAWWSFFPKVILDQATWGPFWNNTYILLLGLMKGESLKGIWADMKRTTIPLVVSGLKLWPLAHCVTYGLIPVENRLLWVDFVEILWVTILATQAAGGGGGDLHGDSGQDELNDGGVANDDHDAPVPTTTVEATTTMLAVSSGPSSSAITNSTTSALAMSGH